MSDAAVAARVAPKGGRPRLYADQSALEALMGRVSILEATAPPATEGVITVSPSDGADLDKKFIGDCIVALIASGRYSGGDGDLPGMYAVSSAMVIARDLMCANIGALREQRIRELRGNCSLGWAGIHPQ